MFLKLEASVSQVSSPFSREKDPKSFLYTLTVNNCKTVKIHSSLFHNKYSIQKGKAKKRAQ